MSRELILCVDDEAVILLSLRQEIKRHFRDRFVLETAIDRDEAIEILDELPARDCRLVLVLSDWFLPGTRGDHFLAEVIGRFPGVKTVLVTGNVDEAEIEMARKAQGIDAFLPKPWKSAELQALIGRLCPTPDGAVAS
jgi:CheY-like chemotaxis protein